MSDEEQELNMLPALSIMMFVGGGFCSLLILSLLLGFSGAGVGVAAFVAACACAVLPWVARSQRIRKEKKE